MKDLSIKIVDLLCDEFIINGNINKLEIFLNILKNVDDLGYIEHSNDWDLGITLKTKDRGICSTEQGFALNFELLKDKNELHFNDLEDESDEKGKENEIVYFSTCFKIENIISIQLYR